MKRLVPIRVGMILSIAVCKADPCSCPHTRGDDPAQLGVKTVTTTLSPYAWG